MEKETHQMSLPCTRYRTYTNRSLENKAKATKIIKNSIDMAPSTGSQSSAQNAAHSCERVPFLALPGLVGP